MFLRRLGHFSAPNESVAGRGGKGKCGVEETLIGGEWLELVSGVRCCEEKCM
jgi:hypothetical protein